MVTYNSYLLTGMRTAERLPRRTQTKTFNKRSTCFGKHSKNRRESSVMFKQFKNLFQVKKRPPGNILRFTVPDLTDKWPKF